MTQGRPLGAKLFLEGIEVPFIGATITSQVNTASIAYVDLVPHMNIMNIKPRTHVLIAVRDYHDKDNNYPYVLAWEGEVFGYNFSKTPTSRMFSISCIDYTSYWDNVLTYFFNAQQTLGMGEDILPSGQLEQSAKTAGIKTTSIGTSTASYFLQIIKDKLKEKGTDFLDGFIEVIKKIGEINDFYKASSDRLKINERITIRSSGQLEELLKQQEALDWMHGILGRESGFATLRTVINDLVSILFHDSVTPAFPSGDFDKNDRGQEKIKKIHEYLFKPNLFMLSPPMCNVFFPDEYSSFSYNRNFFREPTRLIYKPTLPFPGETKVYLPLSYAPESFHNYMFKSDNLKPIISKYDDIATEKDPGHYGDELKDNKTTKFKRVAQFLTNEEKFKGVLLAEEGTVPATDEFRAALGQDQTRSFSEKVATYLFYKKRFQTREFQITGHLKLSVVPGFPSLVLDSSSAGQNVIAYCASVTHRIYATEGGYTTASFAYSRTVQEQQSTGKPNDPLIPPWFKKEIFGEVKPTTMSQQTTQATGAVSGNRIVTPEGGTLSSFYETLLGTKGTKAITDLYPGRNMPDAVAGLIKEYNAYKEKPGADVLDFIKEKTDRYYVRIRDAFAYLGASTNTKDLRAENFIVFSGGSFDPKGKLDESQITQRQDIVRKYRDALKEQRGFKG